MSAESEPLEIYYASGTLRGLLRSGFTLLKARYIRPRIGDELPRLRLRKIFDRVVYLLLITIPAIILETFQRVRAWLVGVAKTYSLGTWQFSLQMSLREDLARHTNETVGYHLQRPAEATELDDLTAWVMTVIQFLWGYEELMGVVWDEWTVVRTVSEAAKVAGLEQDPLFRRLSRQWEVARPYNAPLNGTYADVRRAAFDTFISPRLDALPEHLRTQVNEEYRRLSSKQRERYQEQMSLLARLVPGRLLDVKEAVPLWDACIGLVLGGRYYLINVAAHNEAGRPMVYTQGGKCWPLPIRDGQPYSPSGDRLYLKGEQFYRTRDGEWVGYLDMAPVSQVKHQLAEALNQFPQDAWEREHAVDVLLAESPRRFQKRLRRLLPEDTQRALDALARAPIIINWDRNARDRSLAQLRRSMRGVGDHALTIMRTEDSIIFDHSHIFFDGTWSLAMAEVLTNTAVQWCTRCTTIKPSEATIVRPLSLKASKRFIKEARSHRQVPEVSAETTIWDISQIFKVREMLGETGTQLTINDLLVITRIFHAAHYKPSPEVQAEIESFRGRTTTAPERHATQAIEHSLERGRVLNPSLAIPVDASSASPQERIYLLVFRNLADSLVWIWDDTWDAYQGYRKIEPPDTPEGRQAFQAFQLKRSFLIGNLRAFSYILAASKSVALRGESFSVNVLKLGAHLPLPLQHALREVVMERVVMLNEVIRGDEIYSNVGRVARGSTLSRFMTAKDDGNSKALAWGVMTDDKNRLIVTMRDFRPHVKPLVRANRIDLAHQMARDYVVSYTADLIGLVARLAAMLQAEAPGQG